MLKDKIALVGGAGFVGSRLSNRLEHSSSDFCIFDIDLSKATHRHKSLLDVEIPSSLDKLSGFDCIINLAAVHRDDIQPLSRYDDVNIKGAENICNAATKFNIKKIIFTSSVAIYGFPEEEIDESGVPNYFNDYGRTKYLAEKVYLDWHSRDPLNRTLVIVRPTVIFGEGNRGNVYNLINLIHSGKFAMLGRGKNIKSMAYVENVAAFLEYSLTFNAGTHIYNYIDKPDFDMNTLVSEVRKVLFNRYNVGLRFPGILALAVGFLFDALSKLLKKPLAISSIRVRKFMSTTQFSSSIGKTNFIPPVSLEKGLERTLKYEFIEDNSQRETFDTE